MIAGLSDVQFIFALLITFQIKHLIGDFLLQTSWMVHGKAREGAGFIWPLSIHVFIHAAMTLAILMAVNPRLWYLAILDFAVHFVMDRIKSGPALFGRYTDTDKQSFWIPFGFDQLVHHLTHYFIIWQLFLHR